MNRLRIFRKPPCASFGFLFRLLRKAGPFFFAFALVVASSQGHALEPRAKATGIVTVGQLNMRSGPGLDNPVVKSLGKGTRVEILEYLDGWIRVTDGKQNGYVIDRKEYIALVDGTKKQTGDGNDTDAKIERMQKAAEDIDRQIRKSATEVAAFKRKEVETIERLNEIDLALDKAVKKVSLLKSDLSEIEEKIAATVSACGHLQDQIHRTEAYASKRLVSLYKLSQLGTLHVLASADSMIELFQRKAALERILDHDAKVWEKLATDKAELTGLLLDMNAHKTRKSQLERTVEDQIDKMSKERLKRKKLLEEVRTQKALELAAISSLKQAALDLDKTIRVLSEERSSPVSGPMMPKEKSRVGGKELSAKYFGELKGLLNLPVNGKVITQFGRFKNERYNIVNFRSGIDIQADRGEPIRAVYAGRILYATWFKGYGNMIILDHGNNYCTVYAHLEELFKSKDETVEAGEVIATVGDTGSLVGPSLYFELRHHGKPIDPLLWIKKG